MFSQVIADLYDSVRTQVTALSGPPEEPPLGNLHLVVNGMRLRPAVRGLVARFVLPPNAKAVWLVSNTSRPCDMSDSGDERALGVCVASLVFDDGFAQPRTIAIDDPHLDVGFHAVEDGVRRWTAGRASLPAALWDAFPDGCFLRVYLAGPPLTPAMFARRPELLRLEPPKRRLAQAA